MTLQGDQTTNPGRPAVSRQAALKWLAVELEALAVLADDLEKATGGRHAASPASDGAGIPGDIGPPDASRTPGATDSLPPSQRAAIPEAADRIRRLQSLDLLRQSLDDLAAAARGLADQANADPIETDRLVGQLRLQGPRDRLLYGPASGSSTTSDGPSGILTLL